MASETPNLPGPSSNQGSMDELLARFFTYMSSGACKEFADSKAGPINGINQNKLCEALKKKANEHFSKQTKHHKNVKRTVTKNKPKSIKNKKKSSGKSGTKIFVEENKMDLDEEVESTEEESNIEEQSNMEIYKIKKNIRSMEQCEAERKKEMEKAIKAMQQRELDKKNEIEKNINKIEERETERRNEVKKNIKAMRKREANQKIESEKNIKEMEQREAEKKNEIEKNIKSMKKNETKKISEIEKNIEALEIREAEQRNEIEKNIASLKQREIEKKAEMDRNIKEMQKYYVEKKLEIEKNLNKMKKHEDQQKNEIDKKIEELVQCEAERAIEMEKNISSFKDYEAEKICLFENNIIQMQQQEAEEKSKVEKNIARIKQYEVEMKIQIENSIKEMQEIEVEEKEMVDALIKGMQNREKEKQIEMKNNIKAIQKRENECRNNLEKNIKNLEQQEGAKIIEIEKRIASLKKYEDDTIYSTKKKIAAMQQREADNKFEMEKNIVKIKEYEVKMNIEIKKNIEAMQKAEAREKEEILKKITALKKLEAKNERIMEKNIASIKQFELNKKRKIENNIKAMQQNEAEVEKEVQKTIAALKNFQTEKRNEMAKNIAAIKKYEVEKKKEIEENIKSMLKQEAEIKVAVEKNIYTIQHHELRLKEQINELQKSDAKIVSELVKNLPSIQQHEAEKNFEKKENIYVEPTKIEMFSTIPDEAVQKKDTKTIIQSLREAEKENKINIEALEQHAPHKSSEIEDNIDVMQQCEAEASFKMNKINQNISGEAVKVNENRNSLIIDQVQKGHESRMNIKESQEHELKKIPVMEVIIQAPQQCKVEKTSDMNEVSEIEMREREIQNNLMKMNTEAMRLKRKNMKCKIKTSKAYKKWKLKKNYEQLKKSIVLQLREAEETYDIVKNTPIIQHEVEIGKNIKALEQCKAEKSSILVKETSALEQHEAEETPEIIENINMFQREVESRNEMRMIIPIVTCKSKEKDETEENVNMQVPCEYRTPNRFSKIQENINARQRREAEDTVEKNNIIITNEHKVELVYETERNIYMSPCETEKDNEKGENIKALELHDTDKSCKIEDSIDKTKQYEVKNSSETDKIIHTFSREPEKENEMDTITHIIPQKVEKKNEKVKTIDIIPYDSQKERKKKNMKNIQGLKQQQCKDSSQIKGNITTTLQRQAKNTSQFDKNVHTIQQREIQNNSKRKMKTELEIMKMKRKYMKHETTSNAYKNRKLRQYYDLLKKRKTLQNLNAVKPFKIDKNVCAIQRKVKMGKNIKALGLERREVENSSEIKDNIHVMHQCVITKTPELEKKNNVLQQCIDEKTSMMVENINALQCEVKLENDTDGIIYIISREAEKEKEENIKAFPQHKPDKSSEIEGNIGATKKCKAKDTSEIDKIIHAIPGEVMIENDKKEVIPMISREVEIENDSEKNIMELEHELDESPRIDENIHETQHHEAEIDKNIHTIQQLEIHNNSKVKIGSMRLKKRTMKCKRTAMAYKIRKLNKNYNQLKKREAIRQSRAKKSSEMVNHLYPIQHKAELINETERISQIIPRKPDKENEKEVEQHEPNNPSKVEEDIDAMPHCEAEKTFEVNKIIHTIPRETVKENEKGDILNVNLGKGEIEIKKSDHHESDKYSEKDENMHAIEKHAAEEISEMYKKIQTIQQLEIKNDSRVKKETTRLIRRNMKCKRTLMAHKNRKLNKYYQRLKKIKALPQHRTEKSSDIVNNLNAIHRTVELTKKTRRISQIIPREPDTDNENAEEQDEPNKSSKIEDIDAMRHCEAENTFEVNKIIHIIPRETVKENEKGDIINVNLGKVENEITKSVRNESDKYSEINENMHAIQQYAAEETSEMEKKIHTNQQLESENDSRVKNETRRMIRRNMKCKRTLMAHKNGKLNIYYGRLQKIKALQQRRAEKSSEIVNEINAIHRKVEFESETGRISKIIPREPDKENEKAMEQHAPNKSSKIGEGIDVMPYCEAEKTFEVDKIIHIPDKAMKENEKERFYT